MSQETTDPVTDGIIKGFEAFQSEVNITLFNDIISFIMATTAADTVPFIRRLNEKHIWYTRSKNGNIQEQYGFRYLGELLERFEDRAGSDIRDIRAIALAVAYAKELLTDDMFVGNQQTAFIKKITLLADGDTYD